MDPVKTRGKGPEAKIQADIVKYLKLRDFHVMETHGNMFQCGFPDLYAYHPQYRSRWIEVKNPLSYQFTPAQLANFPKMGMVWIMVAATDQEYAKLFGPPNWHMYLSIYKPRGGRI